jgi:hypothetical protein
MLDHVAAPATTSLLHTPVYATVVPARSTRPPAVHLSFDYVRPSELLSMAAEAVAGLVLAAAYVRRRTEPRPMRMLRAPDAGSVDDCAPSSVVGILCGGPVLEL